MSSRPSAPVDMLSPAGPAAARLASLRTLPAEHQPPWAPTGDLDNVRTQLSQCPPLVNRTDIDLLRRKLAAAQQGQAYVLHIGECAETFTMATTEHIERRLRLYQSLANRLSERTGYEVVLITRMAGQHAKPRSQAIERTSDGTEVLTYRGDAVNCLEQTVLGRRPDPQRLLASYHHARDTLADLRKLTSTINRPVFVSHEALLRDYEEPLTRGGETPYAADAHLLWIGDRTRRLWNWHVQWAATIANPVAVKIGPRASAYDVFDLARALDPRHEPGRLSLITRLGAADTVQRLSPLLRVVTETRAPVLWQCDPMHANTRTLEGRKVRLLPDLRAEITGFVGTLRAAGCHPGGLHLEVTPDEVTECREPSDRAGDCISHPPCDPRLNPDQAADMVDHFADAVVA
ncbi:3-deoxy-7-phosphoheptulonate synthase [Nocardia barduliensis]|uniref:3-deoxy-7-phosphoheptulonate synthase n=1 Tax=Nocardia barduliensis TaxID=2736643 RepID=UPI001C2CCB2B|nr:3-deoxy-7-phosphoheptulonate synthase [Nocardia barduliensis]